MNDSASQLGYPSASASGVGVPPGTAPSVLSVYTSATASTTAPPPSRAFCVVCGSFSGELTLRHSGLKCPKCVGRPANRHWARLQKHQATQLLCQVNTEDQQRAQMQPPQPPPPLPPQQQSLSFVPMPSMTTITDSSSHTGTGVGAPTDTIGSLACTINPEEVTVLGDELSPCGAYNLLPRRSGIGGSSSLRSIDPSGSGTQRKPQGVCENGKTKERGGSGPAAAMRNDSCAAVASHPINDYISKTTIYRAAVHRATLSSHPHSGDEATEQSPPPPANGTASFTKSLSPFVHSLGVNSGGKVNQNEGAKQCRQADGTDALLAAPQTPPHTPSAPTRGETVAKAGEKSTEHRLKTPPPPPALPSRWRRVSSDFNSKTAAAAAGGLSTAPVRLPPRCTAASVSPPPPPPPPPPAPPPPVVMAVDAKEDHCDESVSALEPPRLVSSRRGSEASTASPSQRRTHAGRGSCSSSLSGNGGGAAAVVHRASGASSLMGSWHSSVNAGKRVPPACPWTAGDDEGEHKGKREGSGRASGLAADDSTPLPDDNADAEEDSFASDSSYLSEDREAARKAATSGGAEREQSTAAGAANQTVTARKGTHKKRSHPATAAAGSGEPVPPSPCLLSVDNMIVTVTVAPLPTRAGSFHSRTDSMASNASTGSSHTNGSKPYGYIVKSKTVIGGSSGSSAAAPAGAAVGGRQQLKSSAGGGTFTVTRLALVKEKSSAAASRSFHRRTDSNLSSSSSSAAAGVTRHERRPSTLSSRSSGGGEGLRTSCGGGKPSNSAGGNVEVKKIRYVLHVHDAVTGKEVHAVERGYFNEMIPALEAVRLLAKRNSITATPAVEGDAPVGGGELPPLPSKRIPSLRMATEALLEERRAQSEAFLAAVCASPFLVRHPSIVALLKLDPYLRRASTSHRSSFSVSEAPSRATIASESCRNAPATGTTAAAAAAVAGGGGGGGHVDPTAAKAAFLSEDALDRLRDAKDGGSKGVSGGRWAPQQLNGGDGETFRRTSSVQSGSIQSTRSSVTRRSRLDDVTTEDLAAVQLGNLLGRGTFGSVFLGLIQSVNGPLMIAVKELHLDATAATYNFANSADKTAAGDKGRLINANDPGTGTVGVSPANVDNRGGGSRRSPREGSGGGSGEGRRLGIEDSDEFRRLQGELDILRRARHRNVTRFLGSLFLPATNTLRVFTEYVECGTIHSLVKKFGAMPLSTIQSYLTQLLAGLRHVHDLGIVHRDIKGDNVLVTKNGRIKLSDFGCSSAGDVIVDDDVGDVTTAASNSFNSSSYNSTSLTAMRLSLPVGSPQWMAPEVINGGTNSDEETGDAAGPPMVGNGKPNTPENNPTHFAADVWALGCVGIEMLDRPLWNYDVSRLSPFVVMYKIGSAGSPPHGLPTDAEIEAVKQSASENREEAYEGFALYKDFLSKCFFLDPKERWTVAQLQGHPFLRKAFSRSLRWMPPAPPGKK